MVRREVCCQRPRNGGLGMPDLESHLIDERLAFLGRFLTGDVVLERKIVMVFLILSPTPRPRAVVGKRVKHCIWPRAVRPFESFLVPVTFLSLKGATLGTRFGLIKRVLAHLATCTKSLAPCQPGFQSRSGRLAWLFPLRQIAEHTNPLVLKSWRKVDGSHRRQTVCDA